MCKKTVQPFSGLTLVGSESGLQTLCHLWGECGRAVAGQPLEATLAKVLQAGASQLVAHCGAQGSCLLQMWTKPVLLGCRSPSCPHTSITLPLNMEASPSREGGDVSRWHRERGAGSCKAGHTLGAAWVLVGGLVSAGPALGLGAAAGLTQPRSRGSAGKSPPEAASRRCCRRLLKHAWHLTPSTSRFKGN